VVCILGLNVIPHHMLESGLVCIWHLTFALGLPWISCWYCQQWWLQRFAWSRIPGEREEVPPYCDSLLREDHEGLLLDSSGYRQNGRKIARKRRSRYRLKDECSTMLIELLLHNLLVGAYARRFGRRGQCQILWRIVSWLGNRSNHLWILCVIQCGLLRLLFQ